MTKQTAALSVACIAALLSACGGGSGSTVSQTSDGWQVSSGIAQKGPLLRGSNVMVAELSSTTLQPNGKTYPLEILDDSGTFKPSNITFSSSYLESTALGYYFDELTGQKSTDLVFLRGLSNLSSGQDTAVNVNVLSSFTNQRIKALVNTSPKKTFAVARPQAERELLAGLYIYNAVDLMPGSTVAGVVQPKTFMELDLAKKRDGDQILAAVSALIVKAGQTGSGVNYLINQIEMDLADDGLLNNSPKFPASVAGQLNSAMETTDFYAAARNLNSFYGTTYTSSDLSQWVDTSGGVDQVINKYKFLSTNVAAGVESKSPAYMAGTADAGQCFSVSSGKLYRNGGLVTSATVKAVKGDSFVLGMVPTASGVSQSEFILRSVASSSGVCPGTMPVSGLTRVTKFTVSSAAATFANATVTTVAGSIGNWGATDGVGTAARFYYPFGIASDSSKNLYISETANSDIRKISTSGSVSSLAGFASSSGSTDGNGSVAKFDNPKGIVVDASGNVFIADSNNHTIRKITPTGTVTTLAGLAKTSGSSDGTGASARFSYPIGLALDPAGILYVADAGNNTIRKIIISASAVTTIAGTPGEAGYLDASGLSARFNYPSGLAVDAMSNIYVADTGNNAIRKITGLGSVTTVAGAPGSSTPHLDGSGSVARFYNPHGIAVDSIGQIYVADTGNHVIRKISLLGEVATIAGSPGVNGYLGNIDGSGSVAKFNSPKGIVFDSAGQIFVTDTGNFLIRKIVSN